jgi:hypothetical protein
LQLRKNSTNECYITCKWLSLLYRKHFSLLCDNYCQIYLQIWDQNSWRILKERAVKWCISIFVAILSFCVFSTLIENIILDHLFTCVAQYYVVFKFRKSINLKPDSELIEKFYRNCASNSILQFVKCRFNQIK